MICSECNHMLPDDSEFCQYCGKRLEKHVSIQENSVVENVEKVIVADEIIETAKPVLHNLEDTTPEETVKAIIKIQTEETSKKLKESKKSKNRFCKFCGGQIDIQTKKCSGCGKQYFKGIKFNAFLITIIVLFAVILTSVIINIVQFVEMENLTDKVETQISTISSQKSRIDILDKKSDYYDTLCSELSYGNVGYAANNFRVNESVIVVDKNETDRKITLTANWSNGGNVSVSYSGYSAKVSFDNNSWTTSTKMTVRPISEGITVVKFSNDVDSRTFKMLIIVKD